MSKDQNIVDKAVKLSLVELVIGSTIHALHLPFGGQVLSLNQGFMLTRNLRDADSRMIAAKMTMEVSTVASLMKALAPVGKKLGPMISISMQGFLYMLGVLTFGRNLLGQMIGMILLSPWAFLQPLVTYYIIYGHDLASAISYFTSKNETIIHIIYYVIGFKALVAAFIPVSLKFISNEKIELFEAKIESLSIPKKKDKVLRSPVMAALSELFRPMFLLSVGMMGLFFVLSGEEAVAIFWKIMRAFAIAFLIFYFARNPLVHRWFYKLSQKNSMVKRFYDLTQEASKRLSRLS